MLASRNREGAPGKERLMFTSPGPSPRERHHAREERITFDAILFEVETGKGIDQDQAIQLLLL